jgi:DUF1009 family protein
VLAAFANTTLRQSGVVSEYAVIRVQSQEVTGQTTSRGGRLTTQVNACRTMRVQSLVKCQSERAQMDRASIRLELR